PLRDEPSEHEFTSVCLCDADDKKYYVELHRGPTPPHEQPTPRDKADEANPGAESKLRAKFKGKLGSAANDVAILVAGVPDKRKGYTELSSLTFPKDTQLTLLDALVIATTVHLELPQYHIVNSNCFGHTQLILILAQAKLGGGGGS
ncbi:hypothetical protein C0991_007498, partial [Blastosporella zonata]